MAYAFADDTLFEVAQQVFDDEVLDDPFEDNYALFNAKKDVNEERALEIVGYMVHEAVEAMRREARERRDAFLKGLEEAR